MGMLLLSTNGPRLQDVIVAAGSRSEAERAQVYAAAH